MKKHWIIVPLLGACGALLAACLLERSAAPPRQAGAELLREDPAGIGDQLANAVGTVLIAIDRGGAAPGPVPRWRIGAQAAPAGTAGGAGRTVGVASAREAIDAIGRARSGDVVTFAPGEYRFSGRSALAASGAAGVTVRAEQPGSVTLVFDLVEGFRVSAPRWTFENLVIRGGCLRHSRCEHAFHVSGNATGFVARNNNVSDFNAHFKINGEGGVQPDGGVLEQNTLANSAVRATEQPVTPVDLVGASGWTIRANWISDFVKGRGDRTSYGAFAKGAGQRNTFVGNVIVCEHLLRGTPGQRIGLSLGGGGTGPQWCRDKRCITEQDAGVIESNLIASCSDEGIYLNRAAGSAVRHNTLLDTAGIMLRHPETSADVSGNIVDGRIAASHGALLRRGDNLDTSVARLYFGGHPLQGLYRAPRRLDFGWSGEAPRRSTTGTVAPDLCGAVRGAMPAYGAFEDIGSCMLP